jgi:tRNA-binding EMAP/Myf-like protein
MSLSAIHRGVLSVLSIPEILLVKYLGQAVVLLTLDLTLEASCVGMICSESELGMAEDSEGISELDADAPIGKNINIHIHVFIIPYNFVF